MRHFTHGLAAAALLAFVAAAPAQAQTNSFPSSSPRGDGANVSTTPVAICWGPTLATATCLDALHGIPVAITGGSTGTDYSANRPALPNVGATTFGGSSAFASYVLLGTIPANLVRKGARISADGGQRLALVLDDGTAAAGSPPANATLIVLDAGNATLQQGGGLTLDTDKGRVAIYGPAGAFVSARAY